MSYKGKSFLASSVADLMKTVKDFALLCGWTVEGPSTDPGAQDDPNGHILGWFLTSTGEDSQSDLHVHLAVSKDLGGYDWGDYDYIQKVGGITDTDSIIPVYDETVFSAGQKIQIDDEVMIVGSVNSGTSPPQLEGVQRGWGISDPSSHNDKSVILNLSSSDPKFGFQVFAQSDFTALKSSLSAPSMGRDSVVAVDGLEGSQMGFSRTQNDRGYESETVALFSKNTCLVKVNDPGGDDDGKMRFIKSYTDSGNPVLGGDLTFQPFVTAPGSVDQIDILAAGFLPAWSRARTYQSSDDIYRLQGFAYTEGIEDEEGGIPGYIYGSKDAILVIIRNGTTYDVAFFGNIFGFANPSWTNATAALTAGQTTIAVNNTNLFRANQKVRIISNSPAADWNTNKDRSTDTYGGASPGDWDDLDPEECPTELAEVVSVDHGGGTITLNSGLIYDYAAPGGVGAIIGEDPRPIYHTTISYQHFSGKTFVSPFNPVPKGVISQHATHRQRCRTPHGQGAPWSPTHASTSSYYRMYELGIPESIDLNPDVDSLMTNDYNFQTDQLVAARQYIATNHDNYHISDAQNAKGDYMRAVGFMPFCWRILNTRGGSSEDTMEAQWEGQFETFRMFYLGRTDVGWFIVGPERL
jgi:hypothetical protein